MNPSGSVISQFDYTYNVVGDILTWTQANSGQTNAQQYAFGYDVLRTFLTSYFWPNWRRKVFWG